MKRMLSVEEIEYLRRSILCGIRLDSRMDKQKREMEKVPQAVERSDGFIWARRGLSEIELSVRFEESDLLLFDLGLLRKEELEQKEGQGPCIFCNFKVPFDIERYFSGFFEQFKLSVNIEVRIIEDDGGLVSLFFDALKAAFTKVEVPVFTNMHDYVDRSVSVEVPTCESVAFIEEKALFDPTFLEEMSSDFIVHLLKDSQGSTVGINTVVHRCLSFERFLSLFPWNGAHGVFMH